MDPLSLAGLTLFETSSFTNVLAPPAQAVPSPLNAASASTAQAFSASPAQARSATAALNSVGADGVPAAVLEALTRYVSPLQAAWNSLQQSIRLGDLNAAKQALDNYNSDLSSSNGSMLAATTPSNAFLGDLQTLGSAIQSGDLTATQTAFSKASFDRPDTSSEALHWAEDAAVNAGIRAVYALQHSTGAGINRDGLTADIAAVDAALREKGADIADALVSMGYSRTTATAYANAITGVTNGSAADNAAEDASRADKWIQGLLDLAASANAPSKFPGDTGALKSAVTNLLGSILFSNLASWQELQTLVGMTMGGTSSSSVDPVSGYSPSASSSGGSATGSATPDTAQPSATTGIHLQA